MFVCLKSAKERAFKQNGRESSWQQSTQNQKAFKAGPHRAYGSKKHKKITVRELSELVDINRGTFYLHYKDIYDLVEQIENELFQEFESILMSYTIDDISRRPKQLLTDIVANFSMKTAIFARLSSETTAT